MGTKFWLKRFVSALLIATALLFIVELVKGHGRAEAAQFAALWGAITAALFTLIGYNRYKRNPTCWLPDPGKNGPSV